MKSKFYIRILVVTIGFFIVNCNGFSQNDNSMVIFEAGPYDMEPPIAYEINFFDDGLIKNISRYNKLEGKYDIYNWNTEKVKAVLDKKYVTIRSDNKIDQKLIDTKGNETIIASFSNIEQQTIFYTRPSKSDSILKIDSSNINKISLYINNKFAYSKEFFRNGLLKQYSLTSYYSFSYIDNKLVKMTSKENEIEWEAKIDFDQRNLYTIIEPGDKNEVLFNVKYQLFIPKLKFSRIAMLLNGFLLSQIRDVASEFIHPFVTHTLVP